MRHRLPVRHRLAALAALLLALPAVVLMAFGVPLPDDRGQRAARELAAGQLAETHQLTGPAVRVLRDRSDRSLHGRMVRDTGDPVREHREPIRETGAPVRERGEPVQDREPVRDQRAFGSRTQVFDRHGRLVKGTGCSPAPAKLSGRPEVRAALAGHPLDSSSYTIPPQGTDLVVALPVVDGGRVTGAVAMCSQADGLRRQLDGGWLVFGSLWVPAIMAGLLLAVPPAKRLPCPCRRPRERAAARKAFLTDASHQLRGPLLALRLRLENLEPHLAAEGHPGLDHALSEADRMSGTLSALLTMARCEGGNNAPARPVDPLAIVRERADAWQSAAGEQQVSVEVSGDAVPAAAVPGTLEQILDVFLDNALTVAPPRSRLRLSVYVRGRHVRVSCRDQGPGMSEAERRYACDRFWRGSNAVPGEGSGLGLAIASSLARANNGRLTLDPAPGGGLEASVRLPVWTRKYR